VKIDWNGRVWDYDDSAVTVAQAKIIKNETGIKWPAQFFELLQDTDPAAVQVLMWLVRTQAGEQLRIEDCDGSIVGFLTAYASGAQAEIGEADPTAAASDDSPATSPSTDNATS
jgi:hypothetical protein